MPEEPALPATAFTDEVQGFAMEMFGRPINELTRREQRRIEEWKSKDATEIAKRVRCIMDLTELDVAQRKLRSLEAADQLYEIIRRLGKDVQDLQNSSKDELQAYEMEGAACRGPNSLDIESVTDTDGGPNGPVQQVYKTPGGKLKREVLFGEKLSKMMSTHQDILDKIATLPGGKSTTIIGKQTNAQFNMTPAAVAADLGELQD